MVRTREKNENIEVSTRLVRHKQRNEWKRKTEK